MQQAPTPLWPGDRSVSLESDRSEFDPRFLSGYLINMYHLQNGPSTVCLVYLVGITEETYLDFLTSMPCSKIIFESALNPAHNFPPLQVLPQSSFRQAMIVCNHMIHDIFGVGPLPRLSSVNNSSPTTTTTNTTTSATTITTATTKTTTRTQLLTTAALPFLLLLLLLLLLTL